MNTQKNSNSAFLNDAGVTGYVLRGPDGKFVASFAMSNWTYVLCEFPGDALMFTSMTQALTVGFCLGFGTNMSAVPYNSRQLNLFAPSR